MARIICACLLWLSPLFSWAETFTSIKDGYWTSAASWAGGRVPPTNINNKDIVIINHVIDATNLMVNNGGTMYVNRHLVVNQLAVHGPDSRIFVAADGILNAGTINGNWQNVIYEGPLPVTWLTFSCQSEKRGHLLTWSTAQEVNNDYFVVEYASEDLDFKELARQPGTNTQLVARYAFFHAFPAKGTSYYRIKQVDYDGTVSYSKVVSASVQDIFFQLSSTSLQLNAPITGTVSLIRTDGKPALERTLQKESILHFPTLPAGMYMLRIESPHYKGLHKIYLNN
ncbi:MAG: hypothetical protein ACO1OQ_11415 [Rufibacter sp.]